ncbi:MAG: hypothetical protein MI810_07060, partial [Flavobacteriales bacterium]|nr:hypothetical protein [Flavobacteriales bacterium]
PTSQNVVVAVYTLPDNQDDAIVMNRRFIDMGGFWITADRTFEFTLPIKSMLHKTERMPRGIRKEDWAKIGDDGVIKVGSKVNYDSPLAIICNEEKEMVKLCRLHVVLNDHGQEGDYKYYVKEVVLSVDRCDNPLLLVKITHIRKPQIGDKFASRSAQKGVIGGIRSPEDMIFTMRDGSTPDIVINPHCMPSRQTLGQLITMTTDKSKAISAKFEDYNNLTPFNTKLDLDRIMQDLGVVGEKEICIHPHRGHMIPEPVMVGIAPYQRLIHFSSDKLSAVLNGDRNPETGAPLKGKKRMGGVRAGEMEQNVIVTHGVSDFQHEKMVELSDGVEVMYCTACQSVMKLGTKECIYSCGEGELIKKTVRNSTLRLKSTLAAGGITFKHADEKRHRRG